MMAALNDEARAHMGVKCVVAATARFAAMTPEDQSQVREAVKSYDLWTIANAHYSDRDFGIIFKHKDGRWSQETPRGGDQTCAAFWKIDYFDLSFLKASDRPWDERVTARLLTLMHPHDYW
jgi:Protein of unknown function (DUF3768)